MMFPEDMSYWKKGRIREKDADSSHYDDFYRYGDFGIEHDSDGSWEAYTIVGEKPILAKKGLHSFDEAVEYFKKELESKELKDKGDDKDCKMKDEEPEPPTNPEEDSSGMRLEIFLKSAEDMLSEYQGFTKGSEGGRHVGGLDKPYYTLNYMRNIRPEVAKHYASVGNAAGRSRIDFGEQLHGNRMYRFIDPDDEEKIRAKYGQSKDKWLEIMHSRDIDLDDISDRSTLPYINRLIFRGFNTNRGNDFAQTGATPKKDYAYEKYPQIQGFLPEVDENGNLLGIPRNPFTQVKVQSRDSSRPEGAKTLSTYYTKRLNDNGDKGFVYAINPRAFTYSAPGDRGYFQVVPGGRVPYTALHDPSINSKVEEYGEKSDDMNENVLRLIDDADMRDYIKAYFGKVGKYGGYLDNLDKVKKKLEESRDKLKSNPSNEGLREEYGKNLAKVKRMMEEDPLKETSRAIYKRANEILRNIAPMRVWYDIMKDGAQYTTDDGKVVKLPIRYYPDMSDINYVASTEGEIGGNAGDRYPSKINDYQIDRSELIMPSDDAYDLLNNTDKYLAKYLKTKPEPVVDTESEPKVRNVTKTPDDIKKLDKEMKDKFMGKTESEETKEGLETEKPESEKPETENVKKSLSEDRSAEDILNEWSSGNVHLIREPWKSLVLDAGSKESDPLKIHDDSGNIMFDLRHQ